MGTKSKFINGSHNVIGDISGQKHKRSECVFNWKNQLVHKRDYDPKQPQLTIIPRQESIAVTDGTRTREEDPPLQDPPITGDDLV